MLLARIKLFFITAVVVLLSACAVSPYVTTDFDSSFDFSRLKTYAWIQAGIQEKVSTLDNRRETNAIETILNRKGFSKATSMDQADFLLKVHTVTDRKTNINHYDRFYHNWGYYPHFHHGFYGWPHNSSTVIREYKVGTLILDIVDPVKKQVIWRGTVAKSLGIYRERTPEERNTIALLNAEHLLAGFPPGAVQSE